jgi:hypothetical protein
VSISFIGLHLEGCSVLSYVHAPTQTNDFSSINSAVTPPFYFVPDILPKSSQVPSSHPLLPECKYSPAEQSVPCDDTNKYTNPGPFVSSPVSVLVQDTSSCNPALRSKLCLVHAIAAHTTGIGLVLELIDHHPLENPSL